MTSCCAMRQEYSAVVGRGEGHSLRAEGGCRGSEHPFEVDIGSRREKVVAAIGGDADEVEGDIMSTGSD